MQKSDEVIDLLREAWDCGFHSSREGFNGECMMHGNECNLWDEREEDIAKILKTGMKVGS